MFRISIAVLALCLMLGTLARRGYAQQSPAPDTTKAAAHADSTAMPVPAGTAQADSAMKAATADTAAKASPAAAGAAVAAPAAGAAAAPAAAAPAAAAPAAAAPAAAAPAAAAPATPPPAAAAPAAAAPTSAPATTPPPAQTGGAKKIYFGGSLGFTFWGGISRIYLQPELGYMLTPRISGGVHVGYEHLKDTRGIQDVTSDNWGGGIFGRMKLVRNAYAHAEYSSWSYDVGNSRETVPYVLLGGGYTKPLAPNTSLMVEVLFDVLQDDNSPYDSGDPWVTVGVGVGF